MLKNFLKKTLDSFLVEEVLGDIEVLIVDDGSKGPHGRDRKKI